MNGSDQLWLELFLPVAISSFAFDEEKVPYLLSKITCYSKSWSAFTEYIYIYIQCIYIHIYTYIYYICLCACAVRSLGIKVLVLQYLPENSCFVS